MACRCHPHPDSRGSAPVSVVVTSDPAAHRAPPGRLLHKRAAAACRKGRHDGPGWCRTGRQPLGPAVPASRGPGPDGSVRRGCRDREDRFLGCGGRGPRTSWWVRRQRAGRGVAGQPLGRQGRCPPARAHARSVAGPRSRRPGPPLKRLRSRSRRVHGRPQDAVARGTSLSRPRCQSRNPWGLEDGSLPDCQSGRQFHPAPCRAGLRG